MKFIIIVLVKLLQNISFKFLLIQILFWITVWFFFFYFLSFNSTDTSYVIWFANWLTPVTVGLTYFIVYYLIPKYLLIKKYFKFGLYGFYTLVFSAYFIVLLVFGGFIYISNFNVATMPPMSKNIYFVLILVYMIVGIVSFVHLLNHNFKTASKNKELENKILSTQLQLKEQELQYLKKQIHPHFLFNTLNTIYGFALKQSKQTPDIILRLSNLLDYILYQIDKPKVSLKEEVLHIQEYIELEKIRFQDSLKVIFSTAGIEEEMHIAPMLLIPFVENAFKHGSIIDDSLKIEMHIEAVKSELRLSIRNTHKEEENNAKTSGIGLDNLKKRLDLNYKDNYELDNKIETDWYIVNLVVMDINKIESA